MEESNHAINVSVEIINQSNEVTSFLQMVPVSIQNGGNRLNTYAFLDNGSMVSFIDQRVQEKLRANRVAEILDTTNVSQWKQVSGINKPAHIGTRAINIEDLKRNEWLTGPPG